MLPSEYLKLDRYEKATLIAFIQEKIEADKKEADRLKKIRSKKS